MNAKRLEPTAQSAISGQGANAMNLAMISVSPDVLARLLALRTSDLDSYDDILRRVLGDNCRSEHAKPAVCTNAAAVRYRLRGHEYGASDATEALLDILVSLSRGDPRFFEALAVKVSGRTRNHLARAPSEVYPARPDLVKYVKPLAPGWFIGCNIANREKEKILRTACPLAGLVFGRDLVITLANV
jgi:negative regulator of replication initiation